MNNICVQNLLHLKSPLSTYFDNLFLQGVRHASKKANSSKRNPKQAKGQNYGLKVVDGEYVRKNQFLATQPRLRWHGGLNVGMVNSFRLMSLTEGTVAITCETPDLNWNHSWPQKFYEGKQGVTFYKKYIHVIPKTYHNRFTLVHKV